MRMKFFDGRDTRPTIADARAMGRSGARARASTRALLIMALPIPIIASIIGLTSCSHAPNAFRRGAPAGAAGAGVSGDQSATGADTGAPATPSDGAKVVDAGNPKDIGPTSGKGKLTVRLADAPAGDGIARLLIRPVAIELVAGPRDRGSSAAPGRVVRIALANVGPVDLLQYRDGRSLTLVEGLEVGAGIYSEIRLVLSDTVPIQAFAAGGNGDEGLFDVVALPAIERFETLGDGASGRTAGHRLYARLPLNVTAGSADDITLHIDVRKTLHRSADASAPGTEQVGPLWLEPLQAAFASGAVGRLVGLNIVSAQPLVACAYAVPAVADPTSACADAAGSGVSRDGRVTLPFLAPGTYTLRLFMDDATFVDLPGLQRVAARHTLEIDLATVLPALLPELP